MPPPTLMIQPRYGTHEEYIVPLLLEGHTYLLA